MRTVCLTIKKRIVVDHVRGDGRIDRASYSKGSTPAYLKKILEDTTGAYQLLCANCNILKYHREEKGRYTQEGRWDKFDRMGTCIETKAPKNESNTCGSNDDYRK